MTSGCPTTGRLTTWGRRLATVAVVAVAASPAVRTRDSFPLSTYPVYAQARDRIEVLHTAVGVDAGGGSHRLSLPLIGDSDDPLIVEERVKDAAAGGRAGGLCRDIARRVGRAASGRDELVAVEIVSELLDVVDVAAHGAPPRERTVHARCPVIR